MAEFGIEFKDAGFKDEVAIPEIGDLRNWAGLIKYADAFLGCDSVGQHLAKAMETPASVVMGATYPINTSYPNDKNFKIIDMGQFESHLVPHKRRPTTNNNNNKQQSDGVPYIAGGEFQSGNADTFLDPILAQPNYDRMSDPLLSGTRTQREGV